MVQTTLPALIFCLCVVASTLGARHVKPVMTNPGAAFLDGGATPYIVKAPSNYCVKAPPMDTKNFPVCGGYSTRECDQFCERYGYNYGWCGHPTIDALKRKYCLCHNGTCDSGFLD